MKALILTYAPVSDEEKELLKRTNILKIALNQHAEELMPDIRIITDYILPIIYRDFKQKIVSVREKLRYNTDRVEYPEIEFKGATLIAGLDYLILKGYDEILIIGDNKVNAIEFRNLVNDCIKEITKNNSKIKIYQYTNGNFYLPVMSISDFCD